MKTTQVTDGIFRLSANVENILFEGLWPIPNGISMNSYIVKGDKAAIVDGVCNWDGVPETLYDQLAQMDLDIDDVDYAVINHMEPDHSGWIAQFKKIKPNFTIYTTKKAKSLLEAFYGVTDNIHVVKTGDKLDLGCGKVLAFYEVPNVHWPETMATFEESTGTLLPCDAFGSFGGIKESPYDDQCTEEELQFFEEETLRYYANIVAVYAVPVKRAITALGPLPIKIIAPGHGLVWRKDPGRIVNLYKRYVSYRHGRAEAEVTVLWGSMYGNTESLIDPVVKAMEAEGVKVNVHQVPQTDPGFFLASVFKSTGIVLAMPTYEYRMFPPMAHALDEIVRKKMVNKKAFRFGSYGWSGGAERELEGFKNELKWDWEETVEFNGAALESDKSAIIEKAKAVARYVKENALPAGEFDM